MKRGIAAGALLAASCLMAYDTWSNFEQLRHEQYPGDIDVPAMPPVDLTIVWPTFPPDAQLKAHEQIIEDTFSEVKAYWVAHDVGIAATKLVVLNGEDTAQCADDKTYDHESGSDPRVAEYCGEVDSIIISQAFIEELVAINDGAPEIDIEDELEIVIAHETGHAVQKAKKGEDRQDLDGLSRAQASQLIEQQADCYAGVALGEIEPETAANADALYGIFPVVDITHGTPTERLASFNKGVDTGDCKIALGGAPVTVTS